MMANNQEPHYGDGTAAGHKGVSTEARANSREAAAEVTQTLGRRHRQMLDGWAAYGRTGAIPEQIAADLDLPLLCVRPRAGELVRLGKLFEVGKRPGGMGVKVMAYSIIEPEALAEAA
ncbi:hypothetical protein [Tsuneonella sp. SYSU-LHT278]|uniref:hypothetical protein n=1 Tax=Tsuneonella sediminis TaxID=3416089 RepID=UPI003F79E360